MSDKLEEFLINLASNPTLLWALEENPDSVLDDTELSDSEKFIIKSGDSAMFRTAISLDNPNVILPVIAAVVVVTAVV